jgi:glycosyltransferase involved in cell wall biosynthesis
MIYMSRFVCVIPAYNSAATILHTVESLLNQTVEDISVIVLNNGSTDNTLEVLEGVSDSKLTIISYEHLDSLGESLNRCFNAQLISSKYFSICHSDDIYACDFVQRAISNMDTFNNPTILFCLAQRIDQDGNSVNDPYFSLKNFSNILFPTYSSTFGALRVLTWNTLFAPSAVFRTADIGTFSGFSRDLTLYTDAYFWCHWLLSGRHIRVINQYLLYYRVHPKQQSTWARLKVNQFSEIATLKALLCDKKTFPATFLLSTCLSLHKLLRVLASALRLRA